ncbi:protein ASPARTIC PROTEASE IN GUARD CELL 1-like [Bidens hawaiensis]|uniref:protein ASPARTIC PROTEASE IN GUARD CELL 1-like n=1 Tax=Bidens hawaiensis TaxID=980011 RepID=UPI00404B02D2
MNVFDTSTRPVPSNVLSFQYNTSISSILHEIPELNRTIRYRCISSSFFSHSPPSNPVLHVSDSIHKTLTVLSHSPQPLQSQLLTSSSSSPVLSLQLHSRMSIHKSSHKDYESVTLSRLARDSARVNSILTKLDLAVNGVKKTDLKPVDTHLFAEDLTVPVISGTSQGSGEYFCRVGIGLNRKPCLVDRDSDAASTLEFGLPVLKDVVTAPLLRNNKVHTFYYIGLRGLSVAGRMLNIPLSTFQLTNDGNAGVIVDSGTAITRLQTEAYSTLRDAFTNGTKELPTVTGVALFDTCYDLSKRKSVQVPTVSFHFTNGKLLNLPAKNYLIPVDSSGTFCFAFAPTSSSLSIIGNVQQQGIRVTYDLENEIIGFSPNKC